MRVTKYPIRNIEADDFYLTTNFAIEERGMVTFAVYSERGVTEVYDVINDIHRMIECGDPDTLEQWMGNHSSARDLLSSVLSFTDSTEFDFMGEDIFVTVRDGDVGNTRY